MKHTAPLTEIPGLSSDPAAVWLGRAWSPVHAGPRVVTVCGEQLVDITSRITPTVRDVCERHGVAEFVRQQGQVAPILASLDAVLKNTPADQRDPQQPWLMAPIDFQSIKAAGVTFAVSMMERLIEERANGDPTRAAALRQEIHGVIGSSLAELKPGSAEAERLKQTLIAKGMWSQYLEVGIGPDPEVFTKAQPMSAVGPGDYIGIHPMSEWNNPEPEVVLVVNSRGNVVGATLGNDVNLRDVEGRSALLLGKAKDNNASCAIGPMIRLLDANFSLDDIRNLEVKLQVLGEDGFELEGSSSMAQISRDPLHLVQATMGPHHQYPDGLVLFLGTMFAPSQDRNAAGQGFTHHVGDRVTIAAQPIGAIVNCVRHSDQCPPWFWGISQQMRYLAAQKLI